MKISAIEFGRTLSYNFNNVSYSMHLELEESSEAEGYEVAKKIVDERLEQMLKDTSGIFKSLDQEYEKKYNEYTELRKKRDELAQKIARLEGFKNILEGIKEE